MQAYIVVVLLLNLHNPHFRAFLLHLSYPLLGLPTLRLPIACSRSRSCPSSVSAAGDAAVATAITLLSVWIWLLFFGWTVGTQDVFWLQYCTNPSCARSCQFSFLATASWVCSCQFANKTNASWVCSNCVCVLMLLFWGLICGDGQMINNLSRRNYIGIVVLAANIVIFICILHNCIIIVIDGSSRQYLQWLHYSINGDRWFSSRWSAYEWCYGTTDVIVDKLPFHPMHIMMHVACCIRYLFVCQFLPEFFVKWFLIPPASFNRCADFLAGVGSFIKWNLEFHHNVVKWHLIFEFEWRIERRQLSRHRIFKPDSYYSYAHVRFFCPLWICRNQYHEFWEYTFRKRDHKQGLLVRVSRLYHEPWPWMGAECIDTLHHIHDSER